ncbi:MAG: GIN domain-containing protein [Candidatus Saccharimonadaceae bacterium]
MARVASVNGKSVYSDKEMTSIVNSRINFSDGSWCDVSTGDVHNNGAGYINIGGSDSAGVSDTITEGPKQFTASALKVRGVAADVTVHVHNGSDIEYAITGPSKLVKAIHASVRGGTLLIEDDGSSASSSGGVTIIGGSSVIHSGRGRTIISGGRSISFGGDIVMGNIFGRGNVNTIVTGTGGSDNPVKITIKVPSGTPVNSDCVLGSVTIGDTNGPLTASVQAFDVFAGRVTSAQLNVQGSGDIHVEEVMGDVVAQVQGSGDIEIQHGTMTSLVATLQGSGDINVGGTAYTASLSLMGSGDIRVEHVKQRPLKSAMGSGDIRVRRVG